MTEACCAWLQIFMQKIGHPAPLALLSLYQLNCKRLKLLCAGFGKLCTFGNGAICGGD
jgi:hypothetical protein